MKKNLFLATFIAVTCTFALYGSLDPKPQIQKPAPDAQSLGKFGEIPVDLFTGRVNINIPIYTIKYYDIEIPISISYHGGGIKVTEEAGSVGLGWTLNVGGVVNRIVRGMPDELNNNNNVVGYENLSKFSYNGYNGAGIANFIDVFKQRYPGREPTLLRAPQTPDQNYAAYLSSVYGREYDSGRFDTAADNYMFNVQGLSGAFVHEGGGNASNVILQSNDGVSVIKNANYSGYTITDADGYVYQFQDPERQTYFYKAGYSWQDTEWFHLPEHRFTYPSSWWLSSITSPAGETVSFHYRAAETKIIYPQSRSAGFTQIPRRYSEDGWSHMFYDDVHGGLYGFSTQDTVYRKVLESIETPNCKVRFYYREGTLFTSSPKLDSIAVFDKLNADALIEKTKFIYSAGGKAKLLTLTKSETVGDESQTYIFSYNPSSVSSINDKRRDHWDYYAPNSEGTFSKKDYLNIAVSAYTSTLFADRYACNETAANGMLTKITYPTGGTSNFDWEPHSYSRLGLLGLTVEPDRKPSQELVYNPQYTITKTLTLCGKTNNPLTNAEYTIGSSQTIVIDISSYYPPFEFMENYNKDTPENCISGWHGGNSYDEHTIGDKAHIRVKKNGTLIKIIHICSQIYPQFAMNVDAGTYTFELRNPREEIRCPFYLSEYFDRYGPGGIDASDYGYVYIRFGKHTGDWSGLEYKDVGGVRIKRITNRTETGGVAMFKEYHYVEDASNPNSPSSGVLTYPPRYGSLVTHCSTVVMHDNTPPPYKPGADISYTDCPQMLVLRSSGLPYTLNGGSHIEYSNVIESTVQTTGLPVNDPNRNSLRKTIYSYWTSADRGCADIDDTNYATVIPSDMLQLTSQSYRRGHLKEKIEYTDEEKTTTYDYEILEPFETNKITGAVFTVGDYTQYQGAGLYNNIPFPPYKDMGIVQYRVIPYNKRLKSTTVEGDKTNDYEAYTYESNLYSSSRSANMPLSYTTINSEGDTITQHFTYVNVTVGIAPNERTVKKIHTCVTVNKTSEKIIDAYRNEYAQGNIIEKYIALLNPANLPSASNYNAVALTGQKTESYRYYKNRLVQLTDHLSGVSTVYLWSYGGMYPVVEIQNADFDNIQNILFGVCNTSVELLHSTVPNINYSNPLDNLRAALPQSMVSTMAYKPLVGITSFTDPKGATTYFDYNGFGQLKECYIIENGQKKIVQKMEYQRAIGAQQ